MNGSSQRFAALDPTTKNTVTQTLITIIWTSSGWLAAAATRCRHQAVIIAAKPKASPLAATDAARKARTNKPITSSITAAPKITVASGEDICPASINVRAEMDTLVAVKAPPKKHAVVQERPSRCPTPAPNRNGQ